MFKIIGLIWGYVFLSNPTFAEQTVNDESTRAMYSSEAVICASMYSLQAKSKGISKDDASGWLLISNGAMYTAAMVFSKNKDLVSLDDFTTAKQLRDYYEGLLGQDHMGLLRLHLLLKCSGEEYKEAGKLYEIKYKDLLR